ncbi:ATPase [Clostridium sp.]|uniref:ParM/StbA family protein n=1 Tax=Clostridium sp. TaxID=1506 RepID=UPI00352226A5
MIIGIDLGNYAVKTSTGVHFLSKFIESNGFYGNEIIYDGKAIVVGEGEFQTDYKKSMKENTLPLLYSALALSSKDEQCFQVVLGLPIQQYKNNKSELIKLVEENRAKTVEVNGKKREVFITDITIAPEGASAYYNLPKELKRKIGKKQLVVVDIGGRTTDVCLFKDKKIKQYTTIPGGMLNIYGNIVSTINEIYSQNFDLEDGEEVLRDGLFLDGEYKDISFVKSILKKQFDSIFKELQLNFNVDKGYLLLTGGGANTFKKPFNKRLNNVIVSEDNIFDNVKGFKRVGEQLWLNNK